MNLFGVGPGEAFLVLIVALLVVGPNRFPEVARQAARYYKLARRYTDEVMKDVRAAVDDLEQEVGVQGGSDLRSIRELGSGFASELRNMGQELDQAGRETRAELEATSAEAQTAVATEAESTSSPTEVTVAPAADAEAAELREPRSIRPSKRVGDQTPGDPFAALEAKRARDREREASEPPSGRSQQ